MKYPHSLPKAHKELLHKILDVFCQDQRICGIGASGSYASDSMDQYSDLDLVIAVNPEDFSDVMAQRFELIQRVDGYVAAFTGDHVGEPRLVISIFEPNAVHVDFKFVSLPDAATRVDDTQVLWERASQLTDTFATEKPNYPCPTPQWIEDRFWIWVHYAATKIARGEYFETLEFISFLRQNALSPLALKQHGLTPSGVRTIEKRLPDFSNELSKTVALPERQSLINAISQCISLYLRLRENEDIVANHHAQKICTEYFCRELKTII